MKLQLLPISQRLIIARSNFHQKIRVEIYFLLKRVNNIEFQSQLWPKTFLFLLMEGYLGGSRVLPFRYIITTKTPPSVSMKEIIVPASTATSKNVYKFLPCFRVTICINKHEIKLTLLNFAILNLRKSVIK